uniref:SAM domain-containing protein n=1 Tax=Astatotilapia calliptera TaxID=8154 RepID=A0A3P8PQW6_ASTCA
MKESVFIDYGCSIFLQELDAVQQQGEDSVSALKKAISNGDTDTVKQLLDNGVDVETRLGFEWTPLMCAVSVANYDLAKLLLDRGASANFSKDHWTVLMASCTASASEDKIARCVELLLSRNADPNMVDRSQMTCLMLAARDNYSKVINLLVSHGAEINIQERSGYTVLTVYGREEAVLKLLQLGANKTIRTKTGKSPADLAESFKHRQISRILASSSNISNVQAFGSMEDTPKLNLHAFRAFVCLFGWLVVVFYENDITWSYLLTMEEDDLKKIGVTDPEDLKKVLTAVQQMHLDKVDLETIRQLGPADSGSEELQNFLISISQQCCYLTETIQDVLNRFPRQPAQLVFSLDPKKEAQTICNQLVVQTKDLQKEVTCLRNLLCQVDAHTHSCQPPQPGFHNNRRMWSLTTRFALSTLGVTFLVLLYKASSGKVSLQCRDTF